MAGEGWGGHLLSPGRKMTIQIFVQLLLGMDFFFIDATEMLTIRSLQPCHLLLLHKAEGLHGKREDL